MHGNFEEQFDRILELFAAQGEPIDKLCSLKSQIVAFYEASRQPIELDISKFTKTLFGLKAFEWTLALFTVVWGRFQLSANPLHLGNALTTTGT
jgi:hypothetical protein